MYFKDLYTDKKNNFSNLQKILTNYIENKNV